VSAAVDVRDAFRIFGSGAAASVALQGLTLQIEPGELVCVLGPSGSGKTTLLRVVAGLEPLSAGSARVFGTDLGTLSRRALLAFRADRFGFLDQHYARALSPDLAVRDTVALGLLLRGTSPRGARRAADELLSRVGLLERANDRPASLSGGEQQRVGVCAALAHRPQLVLVDEPAGELDAASAAAVYDVLADLARTARAAALVVSHDPEAATIADRVVRVRDGRIVEEQVPGSEPALVVGTGGWIRLPPEALGADAARRVTLERRRDGLVVQPADAGARVAAAAGDGDRTEQPPRRARRRDEAPVAELRGVRKAYRANGGERVVLDGLDLRVARNELVLLVGRSGTGKTSVLHLLAGLERPSAGDVVVGGVSLSGRSRAELAALRRETIALVTQEPGLVPHLGALENVLLSLALRGRADAPAAANEALDAVGLAHKARQRAGSLSAGERQRVAIARALASGGPLLLADEPTARLDAESAAGIGRLLVHAARVHGRAVVCATHDPALVELADVVVELERPPADPLGAEAPPARDGRPATKREPV
jgi:ABC-type lipoprotein export system ATPase subunit